MRKKIISILSICALGATGLGFCNIQPTNANATETTVYVSSSGSDDTGAGTSASPYKTLDKALTEVGNGGTITLKDTIALNSWTAHNKTVTITGGGLDVSGLPESDFNDGKGTKMREFVINDSVTFTNMSWTVATDLQTFIYANGYETTIGEGVSYSNDSIRLFGGGKEGTTVENTNLTVLSGTYSHIYGGSLRSTVTGNTNLVVGGTVNNTKSVDSAITNHSTNYYVFGGGHVDTVKGSTNVVFQDSAKAVYVVGGSWGWGSAISKGTNVTVTGGTMMGIYGSCMNGGHSGSGATVRMEGGNVQQVFGGSENQIVTGDVDVRIVGGTVTRRIYAGSYGNGSTKYVVSGKINLELGGNANITLSASNLDDKGIYARSRYEGDVENCQIVFTSEFAYNSYKDRLGGADWGASYIMGSTSAADEYHYYTYTANDNVLTQNCAYHTDLAATATLNVTGDCRYTGGKVTPANLEFSEDWEYDKPSITYENNVNIGTARASVSAGGVTVKQSFVIVDEPVVLGGSVRTANGTGLRFQSKVPSALKDSGATFGTLIIPKAILGENELTIDTPTVEDVKQTKWATKDVQDNFPETYEEGYEYFNAVLTDIPAEYYDEVIVARSYVYTNGQYYYAEEVERSIAQVAAYALQYGMTEEALYEYVDGALVGSTLSLTSAVTLYEKESYQLTLSGNKGYVAIWSSDSNILSVDKNGKITAGTEEGTAVVTAKLGSQTVKCIVTIRQRWTGYF